MNTGLRRGEVVKLRWGSVDFNRRLLTVEGRRERAAALARAVRNRSACL